MQSIPYPATRAMLRIAGGSSDSTDICDDSEMPLRAPSRTDHDRANEEASVRLLVEILNEGVRPDDPDVCLFWRHHVMSWDAVRAEWTYQRIADWPDDDEEEE